MSSELDMVQRMEAAARAHREELHEEGICICGWHANTEMDYPAHLAAMVLSVQAAWLLEMVERDVEPLRVYDDIPGMAGRTGAQIDQIKRLLQMFAEVSS